jgi:hypothetical protein
MGMKLLAFHNQFVAGFASDQQDDDFVRFDIIQRPQVADSQFELGEGIGPQTLDCPRGRFRLM